MAEEVMQAVHDKEWQAANLVVCLAVLDERQLLTFATEDEFYCPVCARRMRGVNGPTPMTESGRLAHKRVLEIEEGRGVAPDQPVGGRRQQQSDDQDREAGRSLLLGGLMGWLGQQMGPDAPIKTLDLRVPTDSEGIHLDYIEVRRPSGWYRIYVEII